MTREEALVHELSEIRRIKHREKCKLAREQERRAAGILPRRVGIDVVNRNRLNSIRNRSLTGKLRVVYNTQVKNSRSRGHSKPMYTRDEFIAEYKNNSTYLDLHKLWAESGYDKLLSPFDRLDDSKGYSFDNIQVITWKSNNTKAHEDMRSSKLINGHREIVQLKDGVFTKHVSASEARRVTGVSRKTITNAVNGNHNRTKEGSYWGKTEEDALDRQSAIHKLSRGVLQFTLSNEFITVHASTRVAAESVGLKSSSNIRAVCDGRRTSAGGFIWKYKS